MKRFGITAGGEIASLYTLENTHGMAAEVSDYGASMVRLWVKDKKGRKRDVVAGYDDLRSYEEGGASFGATVGRAANRIADASFCLNGVTYELTANDGKNTLHGGRDFYNKRMWKVKESDEGHIMLELFSPDGDQGFPGNLKITVTYTLTEENELKIQYEGVSDQDTVVNLTNHSYFNLEGHEAGSVLGQEVMIDADMFTRADEQSIPTGELIEVEGTPMDFRKRKPLGRDIEEDYEALLYGHGYDHNWVLNGSGLKKVAEMYSAESGIAMEVLTDLPGLQLYTANFLENERGKEGKRYQGRDFVCFETQYFPDAIHKEHFPKPVIKASEPFHTTTVYAFSVH